jgi:HlyD family secretion protein
LPIIGIIIISVLANKNKSKFEYTTQTIQKSDLIQTVSETGLIKTIDSFDISFELGGNIKNVLVNIGDVVKKDQLLSELDHTDSDIRLSQASASLDIARANLSKLQTGATSQEIAIYTANYNRAKASYDSTLVDLQKYKITLVENTAQAQKTLSDLEDDSPYTITTYEQALETAESNLSNTKITYQKAINDSVSISLTSSEAQASLINNALDQIKSILDNTDIEDYLSVMNKTYLAEAKRAHEEAGKMLISVNANTAIAKNTPDKNIVSSLLVEVQNTLNKTYLSLSNMFSALENSVTSSSFSKTQLDALKAIVNTQISIINTSISSVQSLSQSLDSAILTYNTNVDAANNNLAQARANLDNALTSAKNNLANVINGGEQQLATIEARVDSANQSLLVSQAELNRIKSPARTEDLSLYQAQLKQAQAEINSIVNQIEKSKLKSPVDGIVSKINFEAGEQYILGRPMATLISGNGSEYKIEVDISESDIPKVEIADQVLITLDALGSDVKFHGSVKFIEPAETVIQDVIYYKVEIVIDNNNENIHLVKPGMTANTDITTNEMKDIITIPGRAIIDRNGDGKFVKTFNNEIIDENKVEVGIIGDGGMVQIISGLSEGDVVVTFTKEK